MRNVYLTASVRTPIGRFGGSLSSWSAADLGVAVAKASIGRAGLRPDQIQQSIWGCALIELNEAFAAQVIACDRELSFDSNRLNVNGGAIALGHPIGCTGVRITTTLVHEMRRRSARFGLSTLCVSGGMGIALLLERP